MIHFVGSQWFKEILKYFLQFIWIVLKYYEFILNLLKLTCNPYKFHCILLVLVRNDFAKVSLWITRNHFIVYWINWWNLSVLHTSNSCAESSTIIAVVLRDESRKKKFFGGGSDKKINFKKFKNKRYFGFHKTWR